MGNRLACFGAVLLALSEAAGQDAGYAYLFGYRSNGDLLRIEIGTGAGSPGGNLGVQVHGAAAQYIDAGRIGCYMTMQVAGGPGPTQNQITRVTPGGVLSEPLEGLPPGYVIRAMSQEYVVLGAVEPGVVDLLGYLSGNTVITIGPTGRSDLEGLALGAGGMYALGTSDGGTFCTVNLATGAATAISTGGFGADTTALEFLPDGRLLAAGANLREVNPATGATTLIGAIGVDDVQALAVAYMPCYVNCSCGGPPPVLSVADFSCFLMKFAAGDPYANCDGSTSPPVLNVADFTCFLQKFSGACP